MSTSAASVSQPGSASPNPPTPTCFTAARPGAMTCGSESSALVAAPNPPMPGRCASSQTMIITPANSTMPRMKSVMATAK